jgi:hypothetical protein
VTTTGGGQDLDLDADDGRDLGGLAGLAGLEGVCDQLAGWIAVVRAEQARRQAGNVVTRLSWKNLVFTGGPGSGKSRAAAAVGRLYKDLGVMSPGHLVEVAAADLAGATGRESGLLFREATGRADGGILMITDAEAWAALPGGGQQMLRCLYDQLTELRQWRPDHTAVIIAGQSVPLRTLLAASPPLAARFPAIISFPGYTPAQLAAIFATLAHEAGFGLTPAATAKAAAILAAANGAGSARLAVRLLDQTTACQALRVTRTPRPDDPAVLGTIHAADIPAQLGHRSLPEGEHRPGQYL